MAEQSAFLKALDEMQKKKGGLNAPAPVAPGFQPGVPQELSTPQVGPTLANEAQLPIEQRTQDGTMIGVPDFNEPYIVPEAAQAFGDVPVNMPSNPLDPNAQISATQDRLPSTPNEIIPRGGVRTRGTGGVQSPMAAARVGGIAESESEFGLLDTFRDVINPSEEQKAANLAAGARTGGVQVLPAEPLTPEGVAAEAAPEVMATPESIAGLSVNGTDVVTPEAITEAGPAAPQAQAPQGLNSTQAMLQERFGSPTISGIQSAEEGLGLRTDAQGRMIDPNVDRSFFEQQSAERNERALSEFGQARGPDSTDRAAGEMTTADARDLAALRDPRASASEKARAMKVAERLGRDPLTGAPVKTGQAGGKEPLTFDQQMKVRAQNLAEGKFEYQLSKDATEAFDAGVAATKDATTEEARAETAGKTMTSAIGNMNDAMSRMGGRSGEFFGSGFFGKAASFLPGTSAYDQVADTEFLQSNVALNTMAELKDLSPTGSTGFGALSEKELGVLTNKYANLNPFTSPGLFQKNLQQLSKEFNNMLDNAWSKHSKQYDEASANAIYGNRGGGEPAPASTGTTVNYEGSGYSIVQ